MRHLRFEWHRTNWKLQGVDDLAIGSARAQKQAGERLEQAVPDLQRADVGKELVAYSRWLADAEVAAIGVDRHLSIASLGGLSRLFACKHIRAHYISRAWGKSLDRD